MCILCLHERGRVNAHCVFIIRWRCLHEYGCTCACAVFERGYVCTCVVCQRVRAGTANETEKAELDYHVLLVRLLSISTGVSVLVSVLVVWFDRLH